MARADFVTSLFLIVFGMGVAAESWRMPRFTEFGSSIWSAPGVVPGMVGLALVLMGAALFVRARKALAVPRGAADSDRERQRWSSVALAFAFCFLFAGVLVSRIAFLLAAFLFILTFIIVFDLRENPETLRDRGRLFRRAVLALAVAGAASFLITTVFEDVFYVRLP